MDHPIPRSFDDLRRLARELPEADLEAERRARERDAVLTKPAGALGRLEDIAAWMSAWQGRHPPRAERILVTVFAANHGVAAQAVSAFPAEVTAQMVANFRAGGAAVNQLSRAVGAEFEVHELALERPTRDFTEAPAMAEDECLEAVTFGMSRVSAELDLLCPGDMGIANTTSSAALCHALLGGQARDWVGPGTGVDGAGLARKIAVVERALERHREALGGPLPGPLPDPLEVLRRLGGREIAAILGAILGARLARVPTVLDGYVVGAAAAVLQAMAPGALDHCLAGHVSAEPAHRRLLSKLGLTPILDLGMRLGEASGAVLAAGIVKAAVAAHNGMASFSEAGVAERDGGPAERR